MLLFTTKYSPSSIKSALLVRVALLTDWLLLVWCRLEKLMSFLCKSVEKYITGFKWKLLTVVSCSLSLQPEEEEANFLYNFSVKLRVRWRSRRMMMMILMLFASVSDTRRLSEWCSGYFFRWWIGWIEFTHCIILSLSLTLCESCWITVHKVFSCNAHNHDDHQHHVLLQVISLLIYLSNSTYLPKQLKLSCKSQLPERRVSGGILFSLDGKCLWSWSC